MFSLLFSAERKFLTLCSFVPLHCFLLLHPLFLSLAVILLFVGENPRAVRSDLLPSHPPLPPDTHARLHPVPQPHQPHTHPAGACGPVTEQALLFHFLLLLPSLLLRLLPSLLAQLPAFPLQLDEPRLPPLPPTLPAALLALFLTPLPHSSDQLGLRGHPGVRGHGVPGHGASVCPLPLAPPPASADNGEPTGRQ